MLEHIIAEIERREILSEAIDNIIETQFVAAKRLKRGNAQERIFQMLGVRRNNVLCALVNERMKLKGFKCVKNQGDNYYVNFFFR